MRYDIELCDPVTKKVLAFENGHQIRGGTYCIGGTCDAHLNITYNYGNIFRKVLGDNGMRTIYGLTGAESIPLLKNAINALQDDVSNDYLESTEGNAKRALCGLLAFAQMRPDGIWDGD